MDNQYTVKQPQACRICRIAGDCRDHSEDFMMPDYIPDIRRIAYTKVTAEVEKTSCTADRIGWECILTYTAFLLGDDETLRNVTLQSRMEGELKADGDTEGAWLEVSLENAGMRATDPRRMNGRSRVCISAYAPVAVSTLPEMNADADAWSFIEKKSEPLGYTVVSDIRCRDQRVSEDIELDSTMPEISDIVYCDVRPYVTGTQIKDGHGDLRGEAAVDICYSDINGEYYTHSVRVPISSSFDVAQDDCRGVFARARIGEIKAAAQSNAYGENKVVELDFSWNADLFCAVDKECELITDLYSTAHEIAAKSRDVALDRFVGAFTGNLSVGGESSFEDLSLSNAEGITVCRADACINDVVRSENGRLVMTGGIDVSVICFTGGEREGYAACEMKLPFKYEKDIDPAQDDFNCIKDVSVSSVKARLDRSGIRVDCELVISALITAPFTGQGIAEIDVRGELKNDRAPMTLCFNSSGDDLWSIAKRYNVTGAEILERNGICEDELSSKRVLVIPAARATPGFSKVI